MKKFLSNCQGYIKKIQKTHHVLDLEVLELGGEAELLDNPGVLPGRQARLLLNNNIFGKCKEFKRIFTCCLWPIIQQGGGG